jgi:hypothetical protein
VAAARETADGGLAWPVAPSQEKTDPTVYTGTAGIGSVLLEAWRHLGDDSYADLALRAGRGLAAAVDGHGDDSLYFGRSWSCAPCTTSSATPPVVRRPITRWLLCARTSTGSAGGSSSS